LSITGLGGQFDSSIPRNSGFQLIPRKVSDIEIQTAISELASKPEIVIFPNPTSGSVQLKINSGQKDLKVELFNVQGLKLGSFIGSIDSVSVALSNMISASPKGVYAVKFLQNDQISVKKIMKN
jgi:hypothetical protein